MRNLPKSPTHTQSLEYGPKPTSVMSSFIKEACTSGIGRNPDVWAACMFVTNGNLISALV